MTTLARTFECRVLWPFLGQLILCASTVWAQPTFESLYSFSGPYANPFAGLIQASDGNFYGTTRYGGPNRSGTVFRMTPELAPTTLYPFGSSVNDGAEPMGALVEGPDGNLYGTTRVGGAYGLGTIFYITLAGAPTIIHSFSGTDGREPHAGLVLVNGYLYGTTRFGGAATACLNRCGTVFRILASGTPSTPELFHSFNGTDGAHPLSPLVPAPGGTLYGITSRGGNDGWNAGTVFRITPGGSLTTIHRFTGSGANDSRYPTALLLGINGDLYGTTEEGGPASVRSRRGTVFQLSFEGTFTTLHTFRGSTAIEGVQPRSLMQACNADLYGTADGGKYLGATGPCPIEGCGVLFNLSLTGQPPVFYPFSGSDGAVGGLNYDGPHPHPVQAADGAVYGATRSGGASNVGTLYRWTYNRRPVADDQSVSTAQDTAVDIVLTATDPDGSGVQYVIERQPLNGILSGSPPQVTYRSAPGYSGSDSFTFTATDGCLKSDVATVTITVVPAPPVPPTLLIDGALASAKPQGSSFSFEGSGYTANGTVTRRVVQPDGSEVVLTPTLTADGAGRISWTFASSCSSVVGDYIARVIDDATSRESNSVRETITVNPSCSSGAFLQFPLRNKTPATAAINAVFDHSMSQTYCPNDVITAFTGEEGRREFGVNRKFSIDFKDCDGDGRRDKLFAFRNADGTRFTINGAFTGGAYLYYDGHPGYDFRTNDQLPDGALCANGAQCSDGRTAVFAAASGTVTCVNASSKVTASAISAGCSEGPGEVKIDHGNGYSTVYLHLGSILVTAGQVVDGGRTQIGVSGDLGARGNPHLHFELRRNSGNVPVDPYGWMGGARPDPYAPIAVNLRLWLLP